MITIAVGPFQWLVRLAAQMGIIVQKKHSKHEEKRRKASQLYRCSSFGPKIFANCLRSWSIRTNDPLVPRWDEDIRERMANYR